MRWNYMQIILRLSQVTVIKILHKEKPGKCLRNCTIGVLQISYRSKVIKQIFYYSLWTINRFLKNACIHRDAMQITRVKYVQYLGMSLDENLYWHEHVTSIRFAHHLWDTLGFFYHTKNFVFRISKQVYHSFIYSRIQYGIEAYGSCAKENLSKWQNIQTKLLRLLPKLDPCNPTDLVHQRLSILKIEDVPLNALHHILGTNLPPDRTNELELLFNVYTFRNTRHCLNFRNRACENMLIIWNQIIEELITFCGFRVFFSIYDRWRPQPAGVGVTYVKCPLVS